MEVLVTEAKSHGSDLNKTINVSFMNKLISSHEGLYVLLLFGHFV